VLPECCKAALSAVFTILLAALCRNRAGTTPAKQQKHKRKQYSNLIKMLLKGILLIFAIIFGCTAEPVSQETH